MSPPPPPPPPPPPSPRSSPPSDPETVLVDGRRLKLTNLDKILYPETQTTKGEVLAYYAQIAPFLIAQTVDRPTTRKRWPDGVDRKSVV